MTPRSPHPPHLRVLALAISLLLLAATVPAHAGDIARCAGEPTLGYACAHDQDAGADPRCERQGSTYDGATGATVLLHPDPVQLYAQLEGARTCDDTPDGTRATRSITTYGSACADGTCVGGGVAWWSLNEPTGFQCSTVLVAETPLTGTEKVGASQVAGDGCPLVQPPDPGWGNLLP